MGMIYDQEIEKWSIYLILNLKTECLALELGVWGLLNKKESCPPLLLLHVRAAEVV